MSDVMTVTQNPSDRVNTDVKSQYLLISILLEKALNKSEKDIVATIEGKFKNNGFFFEIDDYYLHFYLKSLDVDAFKKYIQTQIEGDTEHSVKYRNLKPLFLDLFGKIESIKSYGIKGKKRIYVDYNKERKVENRQHKIKRRGSNYYTVDNNFSKTVNELPEEYRNKIIVADSEEELKKLPDNCVDLVFTSPPYNFGLDYGT